MWRASASTKAVAGTSTKASTGAKAQDLLIATANDD